MGIRRVIVQPVYGHIYKVTNIATGRCYIGQTITSIQRRWQGHCDEINRSNSYLHKAIKKYGKEAFQVEELDIGFDKEDLDRMEIHYINVLNARAPDGYNLKSGGTHGKHSEETKRKIAKTKSNPSPETRQKLSKAHKGKRFSERTEIKPGQRLSPNTEFKKGQVSLRRRPVIDNNGRVYSSITEAAQKLGLKSNAAIIHVLNGKNKTAKGISFSYLESKQTV
jgi:group I intron endonuclease